MAPGAARLSVSADGRAASRASASIRPSVISTQAAAVLQSLGAARPMASATGAPIAASPIASRVG